MIAVKQRIPIPIILEIFMMLKVRKELYINFTLIKNASETKKYTAHFARCGVF